MITQSAFERIRAACSHIDDKEVKRFYCPKALVVHIHSGHGFYVDRDGMHTISVSNCNEPFDFTEKSNGCNFLRPKCFDGYWLNDFVTYTLEDL